MTTATRRPSSPATEDSWTWDDALETLSAAGPEHEVVPLPELGAGRHVVVRGLTRAESLRLSRMTGTGKPAVDQKVDFETLRLGCVKPPLTEASYRALLLLLPAANKLLGRIQNKVLA